MAKCKALTKLVVKGLKYRNVLGSCFSFLVILLLHDLIIANLYQPVTATGSTSQAFSREFSCSVKRLVMIMMKLPILPCAEKLES